MARYMSRPMRVRSWWPAFRGYRRGRAGAWQSPALLMVLNTVESRLRFLRNALSHTEPEVEQLGGRTVLAGMVSSLTSSPYSPIMAQARARSMAWAILCGADPYRILSWFCLSVKSILRMIKAPLAWGPRRFVGISGRRPVSFPGSRFSDGARPVATLPTIASSCATSDRHAHPSRDGTV